MPFIVLNKHRRFLAAQPKGEALPEEAKAIWNITQHPACLAQRRTVLPKREICIVIPRSDVSALEPKKIWERDCEKEEKNFGSAMPCPAAHLRKLCSGCRPGPEQGPPVR